VTAATLSDLHSAIVSAIGALKGPLHGGANAEVMRMLLEVGEHAGPERAETHVRGLLARKAKIPGFGTGSTAPRTARDAPAPDVEGAGRADRQPALVRAVGADRGGGPVEKKLEANVDFYSASTYHALGIPIDLFTPLFAVSRISGGRRTSWSSTRTTG